MRSFPSWISWEVTSSASFVFLASSFSSRLSGSHVSSTKRRRPLTEGKRGGISGYFPFAQVDHPHVRHNKLYDVLENIYLAVITLPKPIRRVCFVQLFAFMGWCVLIVRPCGTVLHDLHPGFPSSFTPPLTLVKSWLTN